MPSVSVILPCYNASDTLEVALDSLSRQTFGDYELIAVDDGSTDSTLQFLHSWAEKDSRIKVFSISHGGVIRAANLAISKCTGSFIARMDSDDRACQKRLELQYDYFGKNPETVVVGSLVRGFSDRPLKQGYRVYIDWLNSLVSNEDIRREIYIESPIASPSLMIRTSWILKMGGYQDNGWPEDYDLLLRLYDAGAVFAKVPEVLLEWRDHPKRITRTEKRYSVTNFLKAKAHYLVLGLLKDRDAVIIWGAGMMGRRIGKHLQDLKVPISAYVDIAPQKTGRKCRGKPIIFPDDLPKLWSGYSYPVILTAVSGQDARGAIRKRLMGFGLIEGVDWWAVA
jgi:glycosyltransferase involved in cell wall biosynthesis